MASPALIDAGLGDARDLRAVDRRSDGKRAAQKFMVADAELGEQRARLAGD